MELQRILLDQRFLLGLGTVPKLFAMLNSISRMALASGSKSVKPTEPHASALRLIITGQCLAGQHHFAYRYIVFYRLISRQALACGSFGKNRTLARPRLTKVALSSLCRFSLEIVSCFRVQFEKWKFLVGDGSNGKAICCRARQW